MLWLGELGIICALIRIVGRGRPEWPACIALGVLTVYFSFLVAECLGLTLQVGVLILFQSTLATAIGSLWRIFSRTAAQPRDKHCFSFSLKLILFLLIAATGLGYLTKPLAGPDQYFRWSFLADQMFRLHSLSFYPPVKVGDLERYFWCDGFPPLVSSQLAWTHFLAGRLLAAPGLGFLLVSLVGAIYFIFEIAARLVKETSPSVSIIAFACSTGVLADIRSVCDATVLIPSVLGIVYYLLRASTDHSRRNENIAMAALFAVLASQAREYGPTYGCVACAWILGQPALRKASLLFATVLFVGGFPWYARNLILTGNPMWSNSIANWPANPVHAMLMATYRRTFAISTWSHYTWIRVLAWSIYAAPFAVLGFWGCCRETKRFGLIFLISATSALLFFIAVGSTSSDPTFAFRVYGPAVALLCIPAAVVMQSLSSRPELRLVSMILVCLLLFRSVCDSYLFPRSIYANCAVAFRGLPELDPDDSQEMDSRIRAMRIHLDGRGILVTDDAVLASRVSTTGYPVWMLWDPRIQFSFDSRLAPEDARLHLLAVGVTQVCIMQNEINRKFLDQSPFWASIESNPFMLQDIPITLKQVNFLEGIQRK